MRETLKNARLAMNLSARNMADKIGISLRYYQFIEAGSRTGSCSIWDKLEELTGIPQKQLRENTN